LRSTHARVLPLFLDLLLREVQAVFELGINRKLFPLSPNKKKESVSDVLDSAPNWYADYQMDAANAREALKEVAPYF